MRLSLTRRYVLFVAAVTIALLAASYVVASIAVYDGLSDLFRNRLDRCRSVVAQYTEADLLNRRREIETILSSPRFIAAVATEDSATVALEIPSYQALTRADLFAVADARGHMLYSGRFAASPLAEQVHALLLTDATMLQPNFMLDSTDLIAVLAAPIVTPDGLLIGRLALGHRIRSYVPDDLKELTGFDAIISYHRIPVGHTESELIQYLLNSGNTDLFAPNLLTEDTRIEGERVLFQSIPFHSATVTFVASVDEHIAPIMRKITGFLIAAALAGGLLAMTAIFLFTQRRIGHPIDLLVRAAQRMAADDFNFVITPVSQDELGYLAREFERSRVGILRNREELERAHEDRVKSERLAAIGRLTAGIVHDIKNPMAVIRGNADLLARANRDNTKLQERCSEIQGQVDRVSDLTAELLEYSRGRTKLECLKTNVDEYLRLVAESHEDLFRRAGLALDLVPAGPLLVSIDTKRFRRVLDNLLNNAREALSPGRRVTISCATRGHELAITVTDNGPGIPPGLLPVIFDPFVTHGKQSGTGLGLAITRRIVEDHGGTITVESSLGEGTCFTIALPLAPAGIQRESVNLMGEPV